MTKTILTTLRRGYELEGRVALDGILLLDERHTWVMQVGYEHRLHVVWEARGEREELHY